MNICAVTLGTQSMHTWTLEVGSALVYQPLFCYPFLFPLPNDTNAIFVLLILHAFSFHNSVTLDGYETSFYPEALFLAYTVALCCLFWVVTSQFWFSHFTQLLSDFIECKVTNSSFVSYTRQAVAYFALLTSHDECCTRMVFGGGTTNGVFSLIWYIQFFMKRNSVNTGQLDLQLDLIVPISFYVHIYLNKNWQCEVIAVNMLLSIQSNILQIK
jgi:hypothetical protein